MKKIIVSLIAVFPFIVSCTAEDPTEQATFHATYNETTPYIELQDTLNIQKINLETEYIMKNEGVVE